MDQDATWYGGRPRSRRHCVRWRTQLPPKKGRSPTLSAHVSHGQTAGWIKMPLGTKVGLGSCHIVLDGDPAPSPKGAQLPVFGPCLLWPNGWMDQDATWYGGRPRSRPHCVSWGPSFPSPEKGACPQFAAHVCCCQMSEWIKVRPVRTKWQCHLVRR